MTRQLMLVSALVAVLTLFVVGGAAAGGSKKHKSEPDFDFSDKVVMFAADGMRPDLVDRYARKGLLPEMDDLMDDGLKGKNGLLQAFPPNTGVGWASLATGAWPSSHGSTNNTFHRTGEANFNNSTSFAAAGRPPGGHDRPGRRARREDGRGHGVGRGARLHACAAGPGRGLPDLHRRPRDHAQLRHPRKHRRCLRRPVPAAGARSGERVDERPDVVQPGEADLVHAQQRPDPGQRRLGRLRLRLDQRQHGQLRQACSS